MKKNERQSLIKQGSVAIEAKLAELRVMIQESKLKSTRGEVKNLRERKNARRLIAQLLGGSK